MAYTEEQITEVFDNIICQIADEGKSLRSILKEDSMPSSSTFFDWLENDDLKSKRYARACKVRADGIFDEIIEIAEHTGEDHTPFTGINVIQRDKVRIDARKWMLSKMDPKKYGDRLDVTSDGEKINSSIPLVLDDGRTYEDLKNELKPEEEE